MATREELASKLAVELAGPFAQEVFGPEGPALDCDIDEMEDVAELAARAAFDAVIARAMLLQNQKLPKRLSCPDCQRQCPVRFEKRTVRGRMGPAGIQEAVCHCPTCDRDFFPSAGSVAAG